MANAQSNILLVIPNLGRGGAQQVFRDHLKFFSERYQTIGCVFNWDDTFEDDRITNIISLDIPAGKHIFTKFYFFLKRVIAVRRIKKKFNITVSISHLEGADYVNLLSKRNDNVVCWIHGSKIFDKEIAGFLGKVRKKILIPLTYSLADKVITVSDGIRNELITLFRVPSKKVKTIHNSFNVNEISAKALEKIAPEINEVFNQRKVLISHCRLSPPKNLFMMIDTYLALKTRSDIKLMILGDGELRSDLLNYCSEKNLKTYTVWDNQELNIDFDIYFMGYERNPYPYLHRASLYIMTSSWEGFPLALCEAMACEIPVISTDCHTGPREIIFPGILSPQPVAEPVMAPFGVLMPLANEENIPIWRDMILSLLLDDSRRRLLAKEGKQRIFEFDRKKISIHWLNLIERFD